MTHAPDSHYDLWLGCGTASVSWTQESQPALQGRGLCKEALMCCDSRACLSACPWQRAAKSNANSQAARRAFCLIQFPPLLSQHTTTWKEPLFHIPLGIIALFSAWCISFQLFIWHMEATLSWRPLNQDYFLWTLWGQWKVTQQGRPKAACYLEEVGITAVFGHGLHIFCFCAFPPYSRCTISLLQSAVVSMKVKSKFPCNNIQVIIEMLWTRWKQFEESVMSLCTNCCYVTSLCNAACTISNSVIYCFISLVSDWTTI